MAESTPFYMSRLWLEAPGLTTIGKMERLPLSRVSTPYLVHCALWKLFGDYAPKPYHVENGGEGDRFVRVLGYTDLGAGELESEARLGTDPTVYDVCDWDRLKAKPMPGTFREGTDLRFEVRACPVVRKASAGEAANGREWDAGQELDAFLSEAWENPEKELSREGVYRRWLVRQFENRGGAEVDAESIGMRRFSIERMTRRGHGNEDGNEDRPVHHLKRPDATLFGQLRVTDSERFLDLLRSGIGRHKSFGYGMLKVRRA